MCENLAERIGRKYRHYKGGIYEVTEVFTASLDHPADDNQAWLVYKNEKGQHFGTPVDRFDGFVLVQQNEPTANVWVRGVNFLPAEFVAERVPRFTVLHDWYMERPGGQEAFKKKNYFQPEYPAPLNEVMQQSDD